MCVVLNTIKEGEKEVLDSYLSNVSDEHVFYMEDKDIHNIKELLKEIKASNSDAFDHHIHKNGNDFYNWVSHIIKDKKLATQIKNLTLKQSFVKVLEKRVSFLKKLSMGNEKQTINVSLKTHDKKLVFIVDKEKCNLCDICTKVCPKDAIIVGDNIEVVDDKCTLCGFCVPFCPTAALDIKDKNPMEDTEAIPIFKKPTKINGVKINKFLKGNIKVNKKCKSDCEDCVSVCPTLAIKREGGNLKINEKDCFYCGACDVACPHDAIDLERSDIEYVGGFSSNWNDALEKLIGTQQISIDHYNKSLNRIYNITKANPVFSKLKPQKTQTESKAKEPAKKETEAKDNLPKVVFCDVNKCDGCMLCEYGCAKYLENSDDPLDSRIHVAKVNKNMDFAISCRLCGDHPCVKACPLDAIKKDKDGILTINDTNCDGCGQCIDVCRFGVMTMQTIKRKARVCDFCREYDYKPKCVDVCPTGALEYKSLKYVYLDDFQKVFQKDCYEQEHPADVITKKIFEKELKQNEMKNKIKNLKK